MYLKHAHCSIFFFYEMIKGCKKVGITFTLYRRRGAPCAERGGAIGAGHAVRGVGRVEVGVNRTGITG